MACLVVGAWSLLPGVIKLCFLFFFSTSERTIFYFLFYLTIPKDGSNLLNNSQRGCNSKNNCHHRVIIIDRLFVIWSCLMTGIPTGSANFKTYNFICSTWKYVKKSTLFENPMYIQQLLLDWKIISVKLTTYMEYQWTNVDCSELIPSYIIGFSAPERKENLCCKQRKIRIYSVNIVLVPKMYQYYILLFASLARVSLTLQIQAMLTPYRKI